MFSSLKIIKKFSKDTMIYFGHEYTKNNSNFCLINDPNNIQLKNKIKEINQLLKIGQPTTPTSLEDELQSNIFLKTEKLETFKKLRDLKDNF